MYCSIKLVFFPQKALLLSLYVTMYSYIYGSTLSVLRLYGIS